METAVTPPPEAELHLLTDWTEPGRNARIGRSAVLSVLTHVAAIAFVVWMPETFMQPAPKPQSPVVTPLVLPPLALTQREPNPNKIVREFRSSDLTPRIQAPRGPSPEPQAAAPHKTTPAPPPPPPKAAPEPPLPEPPKVDIAANEPPKLTLPVPQEAPRPKAPSPFEDVTPRTAAGQGILPGQSVDSLRGSLSGRGGVTSQGSAPFASSGAELPRLLSDSKGVDFKPYLAQVLASVKRAWFNIFPKNGHRGYVSVQFAIKRDGSVGKVSYSQQTGDPTLDNTAVMAISAAGPFGPLPLQYTEGEIHVEMNFAYNQPRK